MKRISEILARFIVRFPWLMISLAILLSAVAVPGVTRLETETGFSAFISSETKIWHDNVRYEDEFGGEYITVLLTGQLDTIFSGSNLEILMEFEEQFSSDERYRTVFSPLTLLDIAQDEAVRSNDALREQLALAQNEAAAQAIQHAVSMGLDEAQQQQAAEEARSEILEKFLPQIEQIQSIGELSLDNPDFIESVLYDDQGAVNESMRSLIPDTEHVLILITPEGNMNSEESLLAANDIDAFFADRDLAGVEINVISDAGLVNAISAGISRNISILLGLSLVVMIVILVLIFRVRWRLLSLVMVGLSALWTFGLMGYLSIPLTMTTMAVLPILIGLGIDFSIQFHNRYQEEITRSGTMKDAMVTSISHMFPVVGIALLATIIGFITLYISEVPMVRDFGMVLAFGIVFSFLAGLFLLHSVAYLADRRIPVKRLQNAAKEASGRIERVLLRLGNLALKHTLWIFIISLIFAVGGGVADRWLPTNTDYEELVPQDTPELIELRELREITGSSNEISFMIEAEDVTDPEILDWMKNFQDQTLASHVEIISSNSPATLVSQAAGGIIPDRQQIDEILMNAPSFSLSRIISDDLQMATLSFSIDNLSLESIHDLMQLLQDEAAPPDGVAISPVGSLALAVNMVDTVVGARFTMNLLCLGAVCFILLLVYRRLGNTIFTIIPVGAVIAWSSLDMYLIGIPLNPLTAILGVLVIGICTEFMVLLLGRYDEEKKHGLSPSEAMVTAISKIGRAIVTTALTTLGGFGVLIASDFVMIRDFGIATVVGVFLCLIITMTVMPGLIVWYDSWRARLRMQKNN